MKCYQCRFYQPTEKRVRLNGKITALGQCRLNPPVVVYIQRDATAYTYWPDIREEDWCGRFELQPLPHEQIDDTIDVYYSNYEAIEYDRWSANRR